jgi:hypothetical protein
MIIFAKSTNVNSMLFRHMLQENFTKALTIGIGIQNKVKKPKKERI